MLDIIDIKCISWPYDPDSQFQWIIKNLRENDLHFLLREKQEGKVLAYLNLVDVEASFDSGTMILCWGLGNVCTREKGTGKGREIMLLLNDFIINNNRTAILLCKERVIGFYKKMGWCEIFNNSALPSDIHILYCGKEHIKQLNNLNRIF